MMRTALLLAASACLVACGTTREHWSSLRVVDLSAQNVYLAVVDVLQSEGFPIEQRLPSQGLVESEWLYGTSQRVVRGPSRRKALVRIEPGGAGGYVVHLRVAEEVIRKGGMRAMKVRQSTDWEPFHDNVDDTEYLAAKLRAILADHLVHVETDG